MKNKVMLVVSILFLMIVTGCVNYNASMHINKDKSMSYDIIFMMNGEVYSKTDVSNEIEVMKMNGFTVDDYNSGVFSGYKFHKEIDNIDKYSTKDDNVFILSEPLYGKYIFKVEKGFIKNRYIANFVFDKTKYQVTDSENKTHDIDLETYIEQSDNGILEQEELFNSTKTTVKFNVVLPSSALSNNATNALDSNRNLVWNITDDITNLSFEFELYNTAKLIILHVIFGLLVITFIVVKIIKRMNPTQGVKKMDIDVDTVLENTQEMIQNVPTQNKN